MFFTFVNLSQRQNFWRWIIPKLRGIKCWFHTNDILVHLSDPKFTHLPDANIVSISKEHVISRSHPDNLVCEWDPLDPLKSDPSDPDCPGHPTHFHPNGEGSINYMLNDCNCSLFILLIFEFKCYACMCAHAVIHVHGCLLETRPFKTFFKLYYWGFLYTVEKLPAV